MKIRTAPRLAAALAVVCLSFPLSAATQAQAEQSNCFCYQCEDGRSYRASIVGRGLDVKEHLVFKGSSKVEVLKMGREPKTFENEHLRIRGEKGGIDVVSEYVNGKKVKQTICEEMGSCAEVEACK